MTTLTEAGGSGARIAVLTGVEAGDADWDAELAQFVVDSVEAQISRVHQEAELELAQAEMARARESLEAARLGTTAVSHFEDDRVVSVGSRSRIGYPSPMDRTSFVVARRSAMRRSA